MAEEEIPSEIEVKNGMYCLTEEQIIDLANSIQELQVENELLYERIDIEREAFEDVIESHEETMEIQNEVIAQLEKQVADLEEIIELQDEKLELTEEQLELKDRQLREKRIQTIRDRLIFAGVGVGVLAVFLVLN